REVRLHAHLPAPFGLPPVLVVCWPEAVTSSSAGPGHHERAGLPALRRADAIAPHDPDGRARECLLQSWNETQDVDVTHDRGTGHEGHGLSMGNTRRHFRPQEGHVWIVELSRPYEKARRAAPREVLGVENERCVTRRSQLRFEDEV